MNENKTLLLKENKNALQYLHKAHGFDFEKDIFIGSIAGRFTFKMVSDYITVNLGAGFVAALLIKPDETHAFKNRLHHASIKSGRFEIEKYKGISSYKYNIDYFFAVKDFEETRKHKTERVFIIAQKKEFLLTPKNEIKIETGARYKASDVRKCGDGRGNSWIGEMKLTPATGTDENATFKPYNSFYTSEKRSANINDFIDKSGFVLRFRRMDLKRRALELKAKRDAETLKNTDFSEQEKSIEKSIAAVKNFFIKKIENVKTADDARDIDEISRKFRYLFIDLKHLNESNFRSVESKINHIKNIEKQIDEILNGGEKQ